MCDVCEREAKDYHFKSTELKLYTTIYSQNEVEIKITIVLTS